MGLFSQPSLQSKVKHSHARELPEGTLRNPFLHKAGVDKSKQPATS